MIQRKYRQKIEWLDIEEKIFNETTIVEWYLFSKILLRRRTINVRHTLPKDDKDNTMGFKK